jgi:steroid delta-isomerase-like uncharacterized protein
MSTPAANPTRTPSDVVRELFHVVFTDRDLSDMSRFWSDQSVDHFLTLGESVRGKEALTAFFRDLFAAFPDWNLEVDQVFDDGETHAIVQWSATATFDGTPWQGIEPSGSKLTLRGVDVITLDADGIVVENTVYYDGIAFARQIGMLPRQGSAADRAMLATFNAAMKARARLRARRR